MKPKKELIRIVRNKEGEVSVDVTGKKNGRGAYLSKNKSVIEQARKTNALNKILNAEVSPTIYDELEALVEGD